MKIEDLTIKFECTFCERSAIGIYKHTYRGKIVYLCDDHLLQYNNIVEPKLSYFGTHVHEETIESMKKQSRKGKR